MVLRQQFIAAQKAKKLFRQSATISDEPVVLLNLWLIILTIQVEKLLLSLLSIESSPDQQMTPELWNKPFSVKATQLNLESTL